MTSPTLEARIADDLATAMKAGDDDARRTLRLLRAALQNARIEGRGTLDEDGVVAILARQAKQRREAMAEYARGGREDLVAREAAELAIIEGYLPKPLDEEELAAAVRAQIAAVGATGPADMGRVMGPLMKELAGRADGEAVSALVRRLLQG